MQPAYWTQVLFTVSITLMSYFFIPPVEYRKTLKLSHACSLQSLCRLANVPCRASGAWTQRLVEVICGERIRIVAEPGSWGNVRIEVPRQRHRDRFSLALTMLAYGLHDVAARESVRGTPLSKIMPPRGRPRRGSQRSNRQRQRDFQRKRNGQGRI